MSVLVPGVGSMIDRKRPDRVIAALIARGEADTTIRALILTSSRAVPDMPTDRLSDYDLIVCRQEPLAG